MNALKKILALAVLSTISITSVEIIFEHENTHHFSGIIYYN